MAGDAEVFKQHIAGKDVGGGQLADSIPILFYRIAQRLAVNLLQPQVERHHSPFNIQMTDDNPVAEVGQFVPRFRLQQRQQRWRDLSFLQHEVFKLLRVRHPPDAVMLLYQLIAGAHVGGGHLLLRREAVFDHLEHPVKPRQGKHQHHHPANARRLDKLLIAASDVVQIFAIAFGFGVLLAANRHIQLGRGFTRQDLAQPFHQSAGQGRINHKIGTREAKNDARFGMGGQAGIDKQLALVAAMDRQQEGQRGHRHHQFAHQPGGFVAIEQLIGDL